MRTGLFIKELLFFVPTQLIGVIVALRLQPIFLEEELVKTEFTIIDVVLFFLVLAVFILLMRRFSSKSAVFYKVFLGIAVFLGSETIFSSLFDSVISIIAATILVYLLFKVRIVVLHNSAVLLGIAGISAVFGLSIDPILAVFFLIILSFYDIIAVYKTKHMVRLARDMIRSRAIFGFIMPTRWGDYLEKLDTVEPGNRFMILGSGDIAMPLILAVSALSNSFRSSLIVVAFSVVGLFLTHILFVTQRVPRPMAALPPIAALSIIGYLVSLVV